MVMPRSRSSSFESMTRSTMASLARNAPLWRSIASTKVVFPWSTWAIIAMLRISIPAEKLGQAEKDQDRAIQSQHVFATEEADPISKALPGNGRELVHHQPRSRAQAILVTRRHREAKQRSFGVIGREDANRDRRGSIEPVVLHNNDGARLAGVPSA